MDELQKQRVVVDIGLNLLQLGGNDNREVVPLQPRESSRNIKGNCRQRSQQAGAGLLSLSDNVSGAVQKVCQVSFQLTVSPLSETAVPSELDNNVEVVLWLCQQECQRRQGLLGIGLTVHNNFVLKLSTVTACFPQLLGSDGTPVPNQIEKHIFLLAQVSVVLWCSIYRAHSHNLLLCTVC